MKKLEKANKLEKAVALAAGICLLAVSYAQTYKMGQKEGYRRGEFTMVRHYEAILADRLDEAVQGFRRVQTLRERSEYQRGKESCHE